MSVSNAECKPNYAEVYRNIDKHLKRCFEHADSFFKVLSLTYIAESLHARTGVYLPPDEILELATEKHKAEHHFPVIEKWFADTGIDDKDYCCLNRDIKNKEMPPMEYNPTNIPVYLRDKKHLNVDLEISRTHILVEEQVRKNIGTYVKRCFEEAHDSTKLLMVFYIDECISYQTGIRMHFRTWYKLNKDFEDKKGHPIVVPSKFNPLFFQLYESL